MFGKKFKNPEINRLIAEEQAEDIANRAERKAKVKIRGEAKPQALAPTKTMGVEKGSSDANPTSMQGLNQEKEEDK